MGLNYAFLLYILKVPLLTTLFSDHEGKFLVRHRLQLIGSISIHHSSSINKTDIFSWFSPCYLMKQIMI